MLKKVNIISKNKKSFHLSTKWRVFKWWTKGVLDYIRIIFIKIINESRFYMKTGNFNY